jgi:hypothetical protein
MNRRSEERGRIPVQRPTPSDMAGLDWAIPGALAWDPRVKPGDGAPHNFRN